MRIVAVVAGCIGLLIAAYAADRWLQEIQINVGSLAGGDGWPQIGLIASLVPRLVIVAALAAIWTVLRRRRAAASWTCLAIGAMGGVLPTILMGLHVALQPAGLPFISLNETTSPIWSGTASFLPWAAIGLTVIGMAELVGSRRSIGGNSTPPVLVAGGALLAFAVTYPLDELFASQAIQLASGMDAYPAFMILGLVMRFAVMLAVVLAVSAALGPRLGRTTSVALIGIGLLGFVVLPGLGLLADPFPTPSEDSLAAALNPGTAGRWLACGLLVAGGIAWWRTRRAGAPAPAVTATAEADAA